MFLLAYNKPLRLKESIILIQKKLFHFFISLLSKLRLRYVHAIGKYIGRFYFFCSKKNYKLLKDNFKNSGILKKSHLDKEIKNSIDEHGKNIIETFFIWGSSQNFLLSLVKNIKGNNCLKKAEKRGKGIIFLTPHLGCFEITSIFYGALKPITVIYREARKSWMSEIMISGRKKGYVDLAPTNIKGLKKVLSALKKGEAVGILPDQVADKGQGELADFFGKPAYTMVLVNKLINKTDASIIMAYGERLSNGEGFNIHIEEIEKKNISSPSDLNKQIEKVIKKNPTQYFWSYDRYKKVKKG